MVSALHFGLPRTKKTHVQWFCKLIKVVLEDMQANNPNNFKAYVLAFMAVNLRDAVSVFTRISDMNRELLSNLEMYCKNYFNAAALFVRVTVSVCGHWDMLFQFIQGNCLTSIIQG